MDFDLLFQVLVVAPALLMVVVNVLKSLKIVKEGTSAAWAKNLGLITAAALALINVLAPEFDALFAQPFVDAFAALGGGVVALAPLWVRLMGAYHDVIAGTPIIGQQT